MRALRWAALLALACGIGAGCTASSKEGNGERFPAIQDRNFEIKDPGANDTTATGIGCGGTEKEAMLNARKTAHYNLRGVTGNADYEIRFTLLREVPKPGTICVEVEAAVLR